jgi:hypothetical protein
MGETLAVLGATCMIAAVIGGGVTLAGHEFPVINSYFRQFLLFALGLPLFLIGLGLAVSPDDDNDGGNGGGQSFNPPNTFTPAPTAPAFPNAVEFALLSHIPVSVRQTCARTTGVELLPTELASVTCAAPVGEVSYTGYSSRAAMDEVWDQIISFWRADVDTGRCLTDEVAETFWMYTSTREHGGRMLCVLATLPQVSTSHYGLFIIMTVRGSSAADVQAWWPTGNPF